MKKILMVLTSHSELLNTDSKTGVWLGEFTDPYYEFKDAGYEITLVSPKGGEPPIDATSALTEHITGSNRRFNDDEAAKSQFANTKLLSEASAAAYDAVFFPGGHGPIFDLAKDGKCGQLILDFYNSGKPVSAVCHGSAAFLAAELQSPGFINGKLMTCFSNAEEKLALKADKVPYMLEDALKEKGAVIENSAVPYLSNVKVDGQLFTGQNPLSAGPTAKKLIEALS